MRRVKRKNNKAKATDKGDSFAGTPMAVVVSMLSIINKTTEENKRLINESIFADVFGDAPTPTPDLGAPQYERAFMYAVLGLLNSYHRFDDFEVLLRQYPWRGRMSRSKHFSLAVYSVLNEIYLFEERLKRYFKSIEVLAKELGLPFSKKLATAVMKAYHKSFEKFLRGRGGHVHVSDFEPRELKRISLIELLGLSREMGAVKSFLPTAVRDFRKEWLEKNRQAKEAIKHYMDLSFEVTKPIWGELEKRYQ
jgi:hypothetical protein